MLWDSDKVWFMGRAFLVVVAVIVLIFGAISLRSDSSTSPLFPKESQEMIGVPTDDGLRKETDDTPTEELSDKRFDFSGVLKDVTEGELRGINTKGLSAGIAQVSFGEGTYLLYVTFSALPDPIDDDFYEGWVVRKKTISICKHWQGRKARWCVYKYV